MKKILSLISVLCIAFTAMTTLTSCEDDMIGHTLEGTWEGRMYSTCTVDGRTYSVSRTDIEFTTDPFSNRSGYGYWVDYYSNAPWDRWSSRIDWKVRNGVICITFVEDGGYIEIHDYNLNDSRFTGWFYDSDDVVCDFSLTHTSSPNWNDYYNNYGWGYYGYDYGYAKTRGIDSDSTSVQKTPVRTFHK